MKKLIRSFIAISCCLLLAAPSVTMADAAVGGEYNYQAASYNVQVSAWDGYVNFRYGPGLEYGIIMPIYNGEILYVTATMDNAYDGLTWGRVEYAGALGWISLTEVSYWEEETQPSYVYTLTDGDYNVVVSAPDGYVNLRSGPWIEYDIITPIYNGEELYVVESGSNSSDGLIWGKVTYNGMEGWISISQTTRADQIPVVEEETTVSPASPSGSTSTVSADGINVIFTQSASGDGYEKATIEAYDANNTLLWSITTPDYQIAQLRNVQEIGAANGMYYYLDGNYVVAVDLQTGAQKWKSEKKIYAGPSCFGDDGILYICGYLDDKMTAFDTDGYILAEIPFGSTDLYWPYEMNYLGNVVEIFFESNGSSIRIGTEEISQFALDRRNSTGAAVGSAAEGAAALINRHEDTERISKFVEYYRLFYTDSDKVMLADVTGDGKDEMLVVSNDGNGGVFGNVLTIDEGSGTVTTIYFDEGSTSHVGGYFGWYLRPLDSGSFALLEDHNGLFQGIGSLSWEESVFYQEEGNNGWSKFVFDNAELTSETAVDEATVSAYINLLDKAVGNSFLLYQEGSIAGSIGQIVPVDPQTVFGDLW